MSTRQTKTHANDVATRAHCLIDRLMHTSPLQFNLNELTKRHILPKEVISYHYVAGDYEKTKAVIEQTLDYLHKEKIITKLNDTNGGTYTLNFSNERLNLVYFPNSSLEDTKFKDSF